MLVRGASGKRPLGVHHTTHPLGLLFGLFYEVPKYCISDPLDSYWAGWAPWSGCSGPCGVNITKTRTRGCTEPQNSGAWIICSQGQEEEEEGFCPEIPCPVGKEISE